MTKYHGAELSLHSSATQSPRSWTRPWGEATMTGPQTQLAASEMKRLEEGALALQRVGPPTEELIHCPLRQPRIGKHWPTCPPLSRNQVVRTMPRTWQMIPGQAWPRSSPPWGQLLPRFFLFLDWRRLDKISLCRPTVGKFVKGKLTMPAFIIHIFSDIYLPSRHFKKCNNNIVHVRVSIIEIYVLWLNADSSCCSLSLKMKINNRTTFVNKIHHQAS